MTLDSGNREEWVFEYSSNQVLQGANQQKEFRLSKVQWWKAAKEKVMAEIRESGIEINESLAALTYSTTSAMSPKIKVNETLQKQLLECHNKIQQHQQAADEYEGWIQVLKDNPDLDLKLTQADWLYFFRQR